MPGFDRSIPFRTELHQLGGQPYTSGKEKASRILEVSALGCWRISTVILVILAFVFTLCRMLQLHHPAVSAAAAEAWLEDGQPRWNLSPVSGTAQFFLDIGSSAESLRSSLSSRRARHLEERGWTGICSVPLPGDVGNRTCKLLVLPVAGEDHQEVTVPDCSSASMLGVSELARGLMGQGAAACPEVTLPAVGIRTLLERVDAPRVIDFASVETGGSELSILTHFPFNQHCVRAWTIRHEFSSEVMQPIRHILEVSHGCRIREGDEEFWVRCPCADGAQSGDSTGSAGFLSSEA